MRLHSRSAERRPPGWCLHIHLLPGPDRENLPARCCTCAGHQEPVHHPRDTASVPDHRGPRTPTVPRWGAPSLPRRHTRMHRSTKHEPRGVADDPAHSNPDLPDDPRLHQAPYTTRAPRLPCLPLTRRSAAAGCVPRKQTTSRKILLRCDSRWPEGTWQNRRS